MANIVDSGKVVIVAERGGLNRQESVAVALARLEERVAHMHSDMNEMKADISQLRATANRWRGAFIVLLGIGGAFGVLLNLLIVGITAFNLVSSRKELFIGCKGLFPSILSSTVLPSRNTSSKVRIAPISRC